MRIKRQVRDYTIRVVDDEITEVISLPRWLAEATRQSCDCCAFDFEHEDTASALRLKSGNVMIVHSACVTRLTSQP